MFVPKLNCLSELNLISVVGLVTALSVWYCGAQVGGEERTGGRFMLTRLHKERFHFGGLWSQFPSVSEHQSDDVTDYFHQIRVHIMLERLTCDCLSICRLLSVMWLHVL